MTEPVGAGRSVLLVEDNADNQAIYRVILEHHGFHVLPARTGEEAIQAAREALPDLILMDISIPVIDGWTATGILKSDPATSGIPIIALTAHALTSDRDRAREVGCDHYLAKPIAPQEVLQTVVEVLSRSVRPPDTGSGE